MSTTKGYKWLYKDDKSIFVKPSEIDKYIIEGWQYGISSQFKVNISKSLLGIPSGKCKDPIKEEERKRKISKSMKGNINWKFNKTRGNSKKGWYHGIFCDSTWELAFVVYYIEHDLYITRCKEQYKYNFENSEHIYIPDFITDEGIIEIKGRKNKKALEKEKQFPQIKVIDANLIKPYLNYVIEKYGNEFWKLLYEGNAYKNELETIRINNKIKKGIEYNNKHNILEEACKTSNIDFSKFGWSAKLYKYLNDNNLLFDKMILRSLKKYYNDFFTIYKPFLKKSVNNI